MPWTKTNGKKSYALVMSTFSHYNSKYLFIIIIRDNSKVVRGGIWKLGSVITRAFGFVYFIVFSKVVRGDIWTPGNVITRAFGFIYVIDNSKVVRGDIWTPRSVITRGSGFVY